MVDKVVPKEKLIDEAKSQLNELFWWEMFLKQFKVKASETILLHKNMT